MQDEDTSEEKNGTHDDLKKDENTIEENKLDTDKINDCSSTSSPKNKEKQENINDSNKEIVDKDASSLETECKLNGEVKKLDDTDSNKGNGEVENENNVNHTQVNGDAHNDNETSLVKGKGKGKCIKGKGKAVLIKDVEEQTNFSLKDLEKKRKAAVKAAQIYREMQKNKNLSDGESHSDEEDEESDDDLDDNEEVEEEEDSDDDDDDDDDDSDDESDEDEYMTDSNNEYFSMREEPGYESGCTACVSVIVG